MKRTMGNAIRKFFLLQYQYQYQYQYEQGSGREGWGEGMQRIWDLSQLPMMRPLRRTTASLEKCC